VVDLSPSSTNAAGGVVGSSSPPPATRPTSTVVAATNVGPSVVLPPTLAIKASNMVVTEVSNLPRGASNATWDLSARCAPATQLARRAPCSSPPSRPAPAPVVWAYERDDPAGFPAHPAEGQARVPRGETAEIFHHFVGMWVGVSFLFSILLQTMVRQRDGIPGSPLRDSCILISCYSCAMCQLARHEGLVLGKYDPLSPTGETSHHAAVGLRCSPSDSRLTCW